MPRASRPRPYHPYTEARSAPCRHWTSASGATGCFLEGAPALAFPPISSAARLCGVQIVGALANSGGWTWGGKRRSSGTSPRRERRRATKTPKTASTQTLTETDIARVRGDRMDLRVFVPGRDDVFDGGWLDFGKTPARRRARLLGLALAQQGSARLRPAAPSRRRRRRARRTAPTPRLPPRRHSRRRSRAGARRSADNSALCTTAGGRARHRGGTSRAAATPSGSRFRGRRRLAQLQASPRLHGEPQRFWRCVALALVAAADAARGAAFAERALTSSVDGLEALLSTRDAQVHALAMRALADACPASPRSTSRGGRAARRWTSTRGGARRLAPSGACGARAARRATRRRVLRGARESCAVARGPAGGPRACCARSWTGARGARTSAARRRARVLERAPSRWV